MYSLTSKQLKTSRECINSWKPAQGKMLKKKNCLKISVCGLSFFFITYMTVPPGTAGRDRLLTSEWLPIATSSGIKLKLVNGNSQPQLEYPQEMNYLTYMLKNRVFFKKFQIDTKKSSIIHWHSFPKSNKVGFLKVRPMLASIIEVENAGKSEVFIYF